MADELTSRARALEAADNARRQLLADVSHELMTPLTAMRGYLETLSMPELEIDAPTRERYLQIVTEETHRLERIVGDLLDLARLEGGGSDDAPGARRGRGAVRPRRRAARARAARTRHRGSSFTWTPGAEHVIGDPDRLEQALQNLAANALRHTPDGGQITLTQRARCRRGARLIGARHRARYPARSISRSIFDRFYKADAARKAAGGSGLGLSIVKAIVERHGGTITARNDNGAVFEIVLPSSTHDSVLAA